MHQGGAKDVGARAVYRRGSGRRGGVMTELNSETDFVAKNAELLTRRQGVRRRWPPDQ